MPPDGLLLEPVDLPGDAGGNGPEDAPALPREPLRGPPAGAAGVRGCDSHRVRGQCDQPLDQLGDGGRRRVG
eukprot:209517-Pyramimonas_sp.AAC.1